MLARAWRDAGAQVALVPVASTGEDLAEAVAASGLGILDRSPLTLRTPEALLVVPPAGGEPAWTASSRPVGHGLAAALDDARPRVAVDLTTVQAHDGGAGALDALGAGSDGDLCGGWRGLADLTRVELTVPRALLAGRELIGLVGPDDDAAALTSLRGVSSIRGRAQGIDLGDIMAADAALARLADLVGLDPLAPGTGAAGGTALAILALGGRLVTVPAFAANLCDMNRSLAQADLVVSACTSLDMGAHGGPLIRHLATAAGEYGTPVVVAATEMSVGARELRAVGIEGAFVVDAATPEALAAGVSRLVRSWMW